MTDDDETFPNLPLTQSLTWWVATELIRRHPDELLCHHISSPMGPPYLQVFVSGEPGRAIELPLYPRDRYITIDGRGVGLAEILHSYDRRERFVVPIEESLGLESVSDLAPTSSKTIGFRVMAAFLSRTLLGPGWWVARPVVEFSGDIDGPALHLDDLKRFGLDPDQFNGRLHHLWALGKVARLERVPYWINDVWGSMKSTEVLIDVVDGHAWAASGHTDLMSAYVTSHRSIDRTIAAVLPPTD